MKTFQLLKPYGDRDSIGGEDYLSAWSVSEPCRGILGEWNEGGEGEEPAPRFLL